MIRVKKLSKSFGKIKAINNISFDLKQGEIIALLGPNGAGKTTLMRLLTGYIFPDSGSIEIFNNNIEENRLSALSQISYVPENSPLYGDMSVYEYFSFIAGLHNLDQSTFISRSQNIIKQFSLSDVINQRIETLSKGYRHRVAIAASLLSNPKILILDEPTEGLDPNQKFDLRELLKSYGKDNLVIISTHIMEEVESLSTRIILINKGKIIKDSSAAEFKKIVASGSIDDAFRSLVTTKE